MRNETQHFQWFVGFRSSTQPTRFMVFDANPSVLGYAQPPVLDINTLVQQVRCLRRAMTLVRASVP
ncbi:hypothetical protein [Nostoc sp.]|uniref:hypothetical protein n=1 Tax=Nostoc sp. TaxID=1180 RepID=UPI002FFD1AD9